MFAAAFFLFVANFLMVSPQGGDVNKMGFTVRDNKPRMHEI
jgi:hypothetical protein